MNKRRRLTVKEMQRIRDEQLAVEQAKSPACEIIVHVLPETDDAGNPQWAVETRQETKN